MELADLPFPGWQNVLLETLSWFEIWIGRILRPIKQEIMKEVERLSKIKKEPVVLASFGCGGMELERQILYQFLRNRFNFPLLICPLKNVSDLLQIKSSLRHQCGGINPFLGSFNDL